MWGQDDCAEWEEPGLLVFIWIFIILTGHTGWGKDKLPFHLSDWVEASHVSVFGRFLGLHVIQILDLSPFSLLLENLSYRHAMLNLSHFCFYRRAKQLWQQKKSRQVLGPQELILLTGMWRQSQAIRQALWAVLSLSPHPWEAKHGGLKKPLTDLHWGLSRMFSLNAVHIYCCSPLVENKNYVWCLGRLTNPSPLCVEVFHHHQVRSENKLVLS